MRGAFFADRNRADEELNTPPRKEDPDRDWGMPLASSGAKAPTMRPDDEGNIPEKLIQERIEEADHDQRLISRQTGEGYSEN